MDQPAQVAHLLRRDPGLGRPALPGSVRKPRRPRGRSRRATSRRAWRPSRPARRDAGTPPAPISASHTTAGPCTPPRRGDRGFDVRRWRCAFHEVPGAPARAGRRCAPAPPVSAPGAIVPGRGSLRTGRIPRGCGARWGGNRAPRVRRPCARGERTVAGRPAPLFHRRPAAPWPRKSGAGDCDRLALWPTRLPGNGHLYAEPAPLPCGWAIGRSAATWA